MLGLAALAGCAVPGGSGRTTLDASQLVRTEPGSLQLVDVLPRGLGPGGEAFVTLVVRDENPEVATEQRFALRLADATYRPEQRVTVATYVLERDDFERWRSVQIRLRAQMLAGYADVGIDINSTVCDEAGVALETTNPANSPLSLRNAETGRAILTVTASEPLSVIKERVPFCI